jgi:hypothetical protein
MDVGHSMTTTVNLRRASLDVVETHIGDEASACSLKHVAWKRIELGYRGGSGWNAQRVGA